MWQLGNRVLRKIKRHLLKSDQPAPIVSPLPLTPPATIVETRSFVFTHDCTVIRAKDLGRTPVDAWRWDESHYLLCNYQQLLEVNIHTGLINELRPSIPADQWFPTGIWIDTKSQTIFVANKRAHDVYEFRRNDLNLEIVQRITVPEMKIPDRVAFSPHQQLIAITDYDDNRLRLFNRQGQLLWQTEVALAHGVAFGPDCIAVTSLADRQIQVYGIDGQFRYKSGQFGWDRGEYLWPTSISEYEGKWLVADAHLGKLMLLTPNLELIEWMGGNGCDSGLLNMPYSVRPMGNEIVVCDTFKDRLLIFDKDWQCKRIITSSTLEYNPTHAIASAPPLQRRGYVEVSQPTTIDIQGIPIKKWYNSYGGYAQAPEHNATMIWYPPARSLYYPHGYPYFCWATMIVVEHQQFYVFGHAQGMGDRIVIVADSRGRGVRRYVPETLWLHLGQCVTNDGTIFDLLPVINEVARLLQQFDLLVKQGESRLTAARSIFWNELSPADFMEQVQNSFVSQAGKAFWQEWSTTDCDIAREAAGRQFDQRLKAVPTPEIWLQEVFLRQLLAS